MNRPSNRRGFTRVDLSVALVIAIAAVGLLLPACSSSVSTSQRTESENNLKDLGQGVQGMYDRLAGSNPIRIAAAKAQSTNNLKQMCIAIHGIASRTEGLLPPSDGNFPSTAGPYGTIFCHILADIEQDNVYNMNRANFPGTPSSVRIKTFCAPADPSNPGNSALCSYASNAAVFGIGTKDSRVPPNGGFARFPAMFNTKGTSNTILFFEHYARPVVNAKGDTVSNYWYSRSTALYGQPDKILDLNSWTAIPNPQFDVPYDGKDPFPDNGTAHGFITNTLLVGMADGSARIVKKDVTKTHTFPGSGGPPINATTWQWACCVIGSLGQAPSPDGW